MNYFARSGIFCSKFFSHGCVTQFSMPAIFTSTYPLDFGGYDDGILNRPKTIIEVLKEQGYKTIGYTTTAAMSRAEGYSRGFDKYYSMFDIEMLWRQVRYFSEYYSKDIDKSKERALYFSVIKKILMKYYPVLVEYCADKILEQKDPLFRKAKIYNHDFNMIYRLLNTHLQQLAESPEAYIDQNYDRLQEAKGVEDFFNIRRLSFYNFLTMKTLKKIDRGNTFFKIKLWEKFMSSGLLTKLFIRDIKENARNPFAMFIHFSNVHDQDFGDGYFQFHLNRKIYNSNKELYKGDKSKYYYDLSVNYIDRCIGEIKAALERFGLFDNTHVVFISDHGDIPRYPSSPFVLPKIPGGAFKDDYYWVPMIFWHKDKKPRLIESLHSSLDIGPTICDLLGIEKPATFKGKSIFKNEKGYDYVILEHTHRGPVDLENKPIYIAIRSKTHKYIWKEFIYEGDENSVDIEEFYDFETDKEESKNLINEPKYQSIISKMRVLAKNRFQEIRETVKLRQKD
ncbi:MAG: sulfatase-like hydrolase/transferase [Candidatus Omnitrophica bacterium]|nr:sulfatase-like hydrolase/transferase [Candidatus Omnitrophota bacterium]